MTVEAFSISHPDWQSTSQQLPGAFAYDQSVAYTADVVKGPYYVANWQSVLAVFTALDNVAQITFGWYLDQAMTQLVGTANHVPVVGDAATILEPVTAPWLKITVHQNAPAVTSHYSLILQPLRIEAANARHYAAASLINAQGNTIAATTTTTFTASHYAYGDAMLWVQTNAAVWTAKLQNWPLGGVLTTIAQLDSTGPATQIARVALQRARASLTITNSDAASKVFAFSLGPVIS